MKFEDLIPKLVKAFGIEKDNIVLINLWGENKDINLLDDFAVEACKNGGLPIRWQYSREFLCRYFGETNPENLRFDDKYFNIFKSCSIVVDICTYMPPYPGDSFPKDRLPLYQAYMGNLFKSLSSAQKFIQVRVPSIENAEEYGLDLNTYESALLNAINIDYESLKSKCQNEIRKYSEHDTISVYTEGGRKLSLCIKERKWISDAGDGDMPCGEIYIAPVENMTEGKILIQSVNLSGKVYQNAEMYFEHGRLKECSCPALFNLLKSEEGSDVLCELGIGMNRSAYLCNVDYIDEKVYGTCHIGFGANTMFGGENASRFHADFVLKPVCVE